MRNKRVRMIYKLVFNKDPNMLSTLKRVKGKTVYDKMNGKHIYTWAKRLWARYGIADNWGQTN